MKALTKISMAAALILFAQMASAAPSKASVWETMCLEQELASACDKAVNSLSFEMMSSEDPVVSTDLRARIEKAGRLGCALRNSANCSDLDWLSSADVVVPAMAAK